MCGIVAYFGNAENPLARLLTGMSAIIYRAPDSTGIGFFGDAQDSLRTRKALGSVPELINTLLQEPGYPDQGQELLSLWDLESGQSAACRRQEVLLEQEGLERFTADSATGEKHNYYDFSQLIDIRTTEPAGLTPGYAGNPESETIFYIHSAQEFRNHLQRLTKEFDLSSVVIHSLMRSCLKTRLEEQQLKGKLQADEADILQAFDRLFEAFFLGKHPPKPERLNSGQAQSKPFPEKDLWRCLVSTPFKIPADYDQDAVRCLFRLLDGVLLSRMTQNEPLEETLEDYFHGLWTKGAGPAFSWKTFYLAEKGANVYGLAAAAAYNYLQEQVLGKRNRHGQAGNHLLAAKTEPAILRYLLPPVIAQGRWAIQSQVTLENAHPFYDLHKNRMVVLNGQFTGEVEAGLKDFLHKVAGVNFRSQNSTEYFALLWGYYYEVLSGEKSRYEQIRMQVEKGLEAYALGSQGIDFSVYHQVQDKSPMQLDKQAFIQAVRCMIQGGGQFAVSGLSLLSQHCLYVAAHNRPIFVVRRVQSESYMLVSDVNAAMGLFPQELIQDKIIKLNELQESFEQQLAVYRNSGQGAGSIKSLRRRYQEKEIELLKAFTVEVTPLDGKEIFACISSQIKSDSTTLRSLEVTDFEGNPLAEAEPFTTMLNPAQIRNEVHKTFYEAHLQEIPDRLEDILHMYTDEEDKLSALPIKDKALRRRFGDDLRSLTRLVLIGTGSAYNMGIMGKRFLQRLLPALDVLVVRPVESEDLAQIIVPEKDLVLLLSWSATTADMVDCAKELAALSVLQVGITAKTFADMALITRKSAGVLPIYSGEEITVSGVKSTLCMLFTLDILSTWLVREMGHKQDAKLYWDKLREVPEQLRVILNNEQINEFCEQMAAQTGKSYANVVIDALHTTGTGIEVALKLEENSWDSIGKPLDYSDLSLSFLQKGMQKNLVLVNATIEERFSEALEAMEKLYIGGIPFMAVSYAHKEERDVRLFSNNRCIFLPKLDDSFQPFVDLVFYYLFGFHYGLAHGRIKGRFPRNRAKSVTAGIKPAPRALSPSREILLLQEKNRSLKYAGYAQEDTFQALCLAESSWEQSELSNEQRKYCCTLRSVLSLMSEKRPLEKLLSAWPEDFQQCQVALRDEMSEGGEVIFVPLDRKADSAAKDAVAAWRPLFRSFLRVAAPAEALEHFSQKALVIVLASKPPESDFLFSLLQKFCCKCLWIGPALSPEAERVFSSSFGSLILNNAYSCCAAEFLYLVLSHFFMGFWCTTEDHDKSLTLHRHFYYGAGYCLDLLNNNNILQKLKQIKADNQAYKTAFYIGPPTGTGLAWTASFDQYGGKLLQAHNFGESAHGPLVTVDDQVEDKYVRLRPREQMLERYGEKQITIWEDTFLQGENLDSFLARPARELPLSPKRPFFARGSWFLPILREEYRTENDNLIIIDLTREKHFARALDELSTFGCRFARMIVISQEAYQKNSKLKAIYKFPLSNVLLLPSFKADNRDIPVSDLILPLAVNILGLALSAGDV